MTAKQALDNIKIMYLSYIGTKAQHDAMQAAILILEKAMTPQEEEK